MHLVGAEASWAEAILRFRAHLPEKTPSRPQVPGAREGSDGGALSSSSSGSFSLSLGGWTVAGPVDLGALAGTAVTRPAPSSVGVYSLQKHGGGFVDGGCWWQRGEIGPLSLRADGLCS